MLVSLLNIFKSLRFTLSNFKIGHDRILKSLLRVMLTYHVVSSLINVSLSSPLVVVIHNKLILDYVLIL